MNKIKVVFFGTPRFSVPFLKALIDADFLDVMAVVTEPDRPAGRGKIMASSPIADFAEKNHLQILKPNRIMNNELRIMDFKPESIVVVAYGQIIPEKILKIPKYGAINVHPSDLPRYRGPAPIQAALLNGDKAMKVSVMQMDAKMDHGPVLDKLDIKIDENDNYTTLEKKILEKSPQFLINTLKKYLNNEIKPQEQDHDKATFTKMIKKEDGLIGWGKSPINIHNQIRAYCLWPKAYTFIGKKRLNILKSKIKSGKLKLELVQLEGKKPVSWSDFKNGYRNLIPCEMIDKLE